VEDAVSRISSVEDAEGVLEANSPLELLPLGIAGVVDASESEGVLVAREPLSVEDAVSSIGVMSSDVVAVSSVAGRKSGVVDAISSDVEDVSPPTKRSATAAAAPESALPRSELSESVTGGVSAISVGTCSGVEEAAVDSSAAYAGASG
jgi:hypothetical protein